MRIGLPTSAVFHAGFFALILFGFAYNKPELVMPDGIVPVEIIDNITDQTNLAPIASPESDKLETVEPEGAQQTEMAAPPEPAPTAPDPAAAPKKPEPRRSSVDLDQIASMIDRSKKQSGASDPKQIKGEQGDRPREGQGNPNEASVSEKAAIMSHLRRCWRAPADMANPERLIVQVQFVVNADGSLAGQPRLKYPVSLGVADPQLRAAAESAMRAVSVCDPYPVAADRTRRLDFLASFDPRFMAGVR